MTTARELISSGACKPACISAVTTPSVKCSCACTGRWHGLLADAHLDGLVEARHLGRDLATDLKLVADAAAA